MIVDGRFLTPTGARFPRQVLPTFDCYIDIPTLHRANTALLLFDTGAEQTSIMPSLGRFLRIPYRRLTYPLKSSGVGSAPYCEYQAVVSFLDRARMQIDYVIPIAIYDPLHFSGRDYSLLGRDIFYRWKILYDHPKNRLLARV